MNFPWYGTFKTLVPVESLDVHLEDISVVYPHVSNEMQRHSVLSDLLYCQLLMLLSNFMRLICSEVSQFLQFSNCDFGSRVRILVIRKLNIFKEHLHFKKVT